MYIFFHAWRLEMMEWKIAIAFWFGLMVRALQITSTSTSMEADSHHWRFTSHSSNAIHIHSPHIHILLNESYQKCNGKLICSVIDFCVYFFSLTIGGGLYCAFHVRRAIHWFNWTCAGIPSKLNWAAHLSSLSRYLYHLKYWIWELILFTTTFGTIYMVTYQVTWKKVISILVLNEQWTGRVSNDVD